MNGVQKLTALLARLGTTLGETIGFREWLFFAGTALVGIGLALVSVPAGLVVAGLMLAAIAWMGVN